MENKIFPSSIIHNTVEIYDSRISVRHHMIYLILLGILIAFFVALPLITNSKPANSTSFSALAQ